MPLLERRRPQLLVEAGRTGILVWNSHGK
jgi:hypothetical protein